MLDQDQTVVKLNRYKQDSVSEQVVQINQHKGSDCHNDADTHTVRFARPTPGRRASQPGSMTTLPRISREAIQKKLQSRVSSDKKMLNAQSCPELPEIAPANRLLAASDTVLRSLTQIQAEFSYTDIKALRRRFIAGIKAFETACEKLQVDAEQKLYGRYILCGLVDDIVSRTPVGIDPGWSQQSMLKTFHGDGRETDKTLVLVERLIQVPSKYLEVLELFLVALHMGYEGVKNRTWQQDTVELMKRKLHDLSEQQRGPLAPKLAPQLVAGRPSALSLPNYLPSWATIALTGAALLFIFSLFSWGMQKNLASVINHNTLPETQQVIER